MKNLLILSILIFTVVFSISSQESIPPTIAVMNVVATNTSEIKSQVIYEYILDVVNRSTLYTIVERSDLQSAVKEIEISSSGIIDDTTAAKIGKLAGAEFILISNLIVDDGLTYLSARIVTVETGEVNNTAMLQAEESEYIASLANRTISQLLGQPEGKPGLPIDDKKETEIVEEEKKEEPANDEETELTKPKDDSDDEAISDISSNGSKFSLFIGMAGVLPVLDDAEIFEIGYGLAADLNYKFMDLGKNSLSVGFSTGLFIDKASTEKGVIFPYNMIGIPLLLNLKYQMNLNKLFFTAKIAAGGMVNLFMYTETSPTEETTVLVSSFAASPGLSIGYKLSEKMDIALFCDWSQIFFKDLAYTALNTGLAVDINL